MAKAVTVKVTGRVQGVAFRWEAQREALRLGVTGWVRNEPDGAVGGSPRGRRRGGRRDGGVVSPGPAGGPGARRRGQPGGRLRGEVLRDHRLSGPRSIGSARGGSQHPGGSGDRRRQAPAQRQGARPLRAPRRTPPDGRQRPDLGVRPRPRDDHPRQGRDPDPDVVVVVRPAEPPRREPPGLHRRARRGARPGGGLRAARHVPGGVRGPRLPHRLGPARLRTHRRGLRDRAARRAARREPAARADLHPGHQGGARRARRERRLRRRRPRGRRRRGRRAADADAGRLRQGRGDRPRAGPHPGRHQVRVRPPRRRHDRAGRRGAHARLLALLAGRELAAGPPQASYDKQIVRDWLLSPASGWDRASGEPPPPLPDEIVERTRTRYLEAYELLAGEPW